MKLSEALKLLEEGKKIYHEKLPCEIYQLIDHSLKVFRKYENCNFFILLDLENELSIDCKRMLTGWHEAKGKIPISFNLAKEFYKNGKTIRRIGSAEIFNKIDSCIIASAFGVTQLLVTLEDIEGNDWEVLDEHN